MFFPGFLLHKASHRQLVEVPLPDFILRFDEKVDFICIVFKGLLPFIAFLVRLNTQLIKVLFPGMG